MLQGCPRLKLCDHTAAMCVPTRIWGACAGGHGAKSTVTRHQLTAARMLCVRMRYSYLAPPELSCICMYTRPVARPVHGSRAPEHVGIPHVISNLPRFRYAPAYCLGPEHGESWGLLEHGYR